MSMFLESDFSKGEMPLGRGDSCELDFVGPPEEALSEVVVLASVVDCEEGAKALQVWLSNRMAEHEMMNCNDTRRVLIILLSINKK